MTAPDEPVTPPPQSYSTAAAELDAILDEIESGCTDLDTLSAKVERAASLIRWCRERLAGTEMQVVKVLDALDAGAKPGADSEPLDERAAEDAAGGS